MVRNRQLYTLLALVSAWFATVVTADPPSIGTSKTAAEWLSVVKTAVEVPQNGDMNASGVFTAKLHQRNPAQPPGEFRLEFLTLGQISILVLFLSGLASKGSDPTKTKRFFGDAIAKIEVERIREPNSYPISKYHSQGWFFDMKLLVLQHLFETCIVKMDYDEAYELLQVLSRHVAQVPEVQTDWETTLALNVAAFLQATGRSVEAIPWLEGAAGKTSSENRDIRFAAMLNMVLIYCGKEDRNLEMAKIILEALQKELDGYRHQPPPDYYQGAFHYVQAVVVTQPEVQKLQQAKNYLTTALKHSDTTLQVKALTLAMLGDVFLKLDPSK
ncbi:hypothetical protein HDU93_004198, partial [Gonapodya sp. JEL0774]